MKKGTLAIALIALSAASFPAIIQAADADLPVGRRAARHYRATGECGSRPCSPRCPDRYSCAPLFGAYGPWGGASYWAGYSDTVGPRYTGGWGY